MPKIFLSHRRQDTGPLTGRVYDRLSLVLPPSDIFFDVSTIKGGETFEKRILESIEASDFVLAIIGPDWFGKSRYRTDAPRIEDDDDYVRAEIRAAILKNKKLIPIVVDKTSMPKAESLPDDIKVLAGLNALPLRHRTFTADLDEITSQTLGFRISDRLKANRRSLLRRTGAALLGTLVGLFAFAVIGLVHVQLLDKPIELTLTPIGLLMAALACAAGGLALGWKLSKAS